MTQSIVIQVGQCGNQIGHRFWELALQEHRAVSKPLLWDDSLSSFLQNIDEKTGRNLPLGEKISNLKARAVLIDMEEGVVNDILKSPLARLYDQTQLITDVSGAGNNWAVGYHEYGRKYRERISNVIRQTAERCDCLQSFFCLHSMGGGTGSGVGTYVLRLLQEEYPEVYRFVTAVYPSDDDDVVTSPYNSVLAMQQLTEAADCVLPIENQALLEILSRNISAAEIKAKKAKKPFDGMNSIAANLILNLTSSSRFDGSMNIDLNEITMNLVPFPRLHYLTSSMTPIYNASGTNLPPRNLNQMFTDAFSRDCQLLRVDPKNGLYLACALMLRGDVEVSDVRSNINRLRSRLNFVSWNADGWKTGMCSVPMLGHKRNLLTLANNTCFHHPCVELCNRFVKLYKRRAHTHHYASVDGFETAEFTQALESLNVLITDYEQLEATARYPPPEIERLKVL